MNRLIFSLLWVVLVTFSALLPANVQAGEREQMLLKQIDQQMHPGSYERYFQIINHQPNGKKNQITAYSAEDGNGKAVILIVAPKTLQGRAALRLGDQVWTHIPGEIQLRESSLRHALVGGVFNNADLLSVPFHLNHTLEKVTENKNQLTVTLTANSADIPYQYIELTVDKKSKTPLTLTQFATAGIVIKTIDFSYGKKSPDSEQPLPTLSTMAEENNKYRSEIQTGTIRSRNFPAETFTQSLLPQLGSILK
ncbi:MAG: outer membrane lipoprotein-sorting protein [Magnetococcales bacterium]|nr:outer membrane lipoprotein-sorting protein [Magnetococcales bacterium]